MACEISLGQGLNPCPLHWQVDSYPLCHPGKPLFGKKKKKNPLAHQGSPYLFVENLN